MKLVHNMEQDLEMISKWLKESDSVVNVSITKLCLFNRFDTRAICIGTEVTSKVQINVLGVLFDKKNCTQVSNTIAKPKRVLSCNKIYKTTFQ